MIRPFTAYAALSVLLGALSGNVALWLYSTTLGWLTVRETGGSSVALGFLAFTSLLPFALLAVHGGEIADRYDPRRVVVAANAIMSVAFGVLGVLALGGAVTYAAIVVVGFVVGTALSLSIPSGYALLYGLVSRSELGRVTAINLAQSNLARIIGPVIAGFWIGRAGEGQVLLGAAAAMAVFAAACAAVPSTRPARPNPREATRARATLRLVAADPTLVYLLVVMLLLAILVTPATALLPLFADHTLRVGAAGLGIMSASYGAGAMLGSLLGLSGRIGQRVVVGGLLAAGLALMGVGLSVDFRVTCAALWLMGAGSYLATTRATTAIQTRASPGHLGRVVGIFQMATSAPTAIATLTFGALAVLFGAGPVVASAGAVAIICTLVISTRRPSLSSAMPAPPDVIVAASRAASIASNDRVQDPAGR